MRHSIWSPETEDYLRYQPTWTFCRREDELLLLLVPEAMVYDVDPVLLQDAVGRSRDRDNSVVCARLPSRERRSSCARLLLCDFLALSATAWSRNCLEVNIGLSNSQSYQRPPLDQSICLGNEMSDGMRARGIDVSVDKRCWNVRRL